MDYSFISYHYVSAPAGSGKTYAAIRFAIDRARLGEKALIAQPSKRCIAEWFAHTRAYVDGLKGKPVAVSRYDGDVCEAGHIVQAIARHLEDPAADGEVLFLTHAALLRIADHPRAADWHLIVDEIPAPDTFFAKHLPKNHGILTEAIMTEDHSAECVRVLPADALRLKGYALNQSRDEINAEFQAIAGCLISPHYEVFAIRENLQRTLDDETEAGKYPLYLFALLQPSVFRSFQSVVIIGACFEESMLAILWSSRGVDFRPHARLTKRLRFTEHPNGDRLQIRYLTDDPWSKRQAVKRKIVDGREVTNNDLALEAVRHLFANQPFLYLVNKDTDAAARALFMELAAEPLPHTPHGLNCFAHYHNLAAIASFLPPPFHHRFLATQNLTGEAIRDAVHHQAVYQAVCRSSLRDLESTSPVKVLLTDKRVAEWLADQFPGCALAPVGDVPLIRRGQPGRKRTHANAKARVGAYRQRQREQEEDLMLAQLIPDLQEGTVFLKRNVKIDLSSDIVTAPLSPQENESLAEERFFADLSFLRSELWVGTLFRHRKDTDTSRHVTVNSLAQVIEWLRHLHGLSHGDKHDNWLISPALFNPTLGETSRGTDNVILACGIWLDVDGGDLPYSRFQRIFPGVRMAIYNTWSSQDATRYRVFIPTTGYLMAETYRSLCQELVQTVQLRGYCSPRQKQKGSSKPCHGIDLGKTYAANMMYLPCQPRPGGLTFFEDYDGEPVDPALWLANSVAPVPMATPPAFPPADLLLPPSANDNIGEPVACARKFLQTAASRILTAGEGQRNDSLYYASRACFALADAGLLNTFEVETSLSTTARSAGLESAEIKATMASARKSPWKKRQFAEEMRSRNAGGVRRVSK